MPLNDVPYIQQVVAQYNKQISVKVVSEVTYSIIDEPDVVTLLTEGTHDLDDAVRDLDWPMTDVGYGRVHQGAHNGIPQVIDAEWNNFSTDKLTRLIGHSLGAMEAGLAACELYRRGFTNIEVITFGCPRWGDNNAMRYFSQIKSRTYKNYNNLLEHDFFTTIPPHLILNPFMPVPNEIIGWSAPTPQNEFAGKGILIEAHSSNDCYLPLVSRLCAMPSVG